VSGREVLGHDLSGFRFFRLAMAALTSGVVLVKLPDLASNIADTIFIGSSISTLTRRSV